MTATQYNITIQRGDCYTVEVVYKADNVAVDLTGYTAEMAVAESPPLRPSPYHRPYALFSTETGHIDALGIDGRIVVNLTAKDTANVDPRSSKGSPSYQLRITAPDGCVATLLRGNISLLPNHFEVPQ